MCIFAQPVISVKHTQIFARASSRGSQFLVYQMNYESSEENAMILPIPVRRPSHDRSLRFIDLKDYSEFFDDLMTGFPFSPPSFNIGCSVPTNPNASSSLDVFNVGNYIASFVPHLAEFSRLDARFTLSENTWSQIPQYHDFGFAVFQLAAGAFQPHPMAFEFEGASETIYFPTMHIHDGEIHQTEEFDHILYLQHAGFDSRVFGYQNANVPDGATDLIRSKNVAKYFCDVSRSNGTISADLLVHRRIIRGSNPNGDTLISTMGHPETPTLNLRPLLSYFPWLVTFGAVAWFFSRRNKIKKMNNVGRTSVQTREDRDRTD